MTNIKPPLKDFFIKWMKNHQVWNEWKAEIENIGNQEVSDVLDFCNPKEFLDNENHIQWDVSIIDWKSLNIEWKEYYENNKTM